MTPISIENTWFKRTWIIDDYGIQEQRRDALPIRISWSELQYRSATTFSGGGKSIRIALDPKARLPFMQAADREWQTRYPQPHAANKKRMYKRFKIATFAVMPVVILAPVVTMWIFVFLCHHYSLPDKLPKIQDTAIRTTILNTGMLLVFWAYVYVKIIRKQNRNKIV